MSDDASAALADDAGAVALLDVVGRLVERAREAGALRPDVSVSDVLLVIATAAPSLPDAAQQAAASSRLLDILLEGLGRGPCEWSERRIFRALRTTPLRGKAG